MRLRGSADVRRRPSIAEIDAGRAAGQNLSSAIRVFVLAAVKARGAGA